jgi:hypothetical protein
MNKSRYEVVYFSTNQDKQIKHKIKCLTLSDALVETRFLYHFKSIPRIELWKGDFRLLLVLH